MAEDLVVFLRKMFKDMLLFLDGQHSDPVFFAIAAVVQELGDSFTPAEGGIRCQLPYICNDLRLLQVQGFDDKFLFCLEKRIEEGGGKDGRK